MKNLLLLIVVIGTLSFTLKNEVAKVSEKATIATGKLSPKFSFLNNNDKVVTLDDFKGKYVYINFWTTWSQPSQEELPHLQNIIDSYGNDIVFVNLSVDYQRDLKTWKQAISDKNLKGIHVIANDAWKSEFIKTYDVVKIPRAILIDKEGKIVSAFAPKPSSGNDLISLLDSIK